MPTQKYDCAQKVWAVLPSLMRTISARLRQQEPRLDITVWQVMAMKWLRGEALTVGDLARKFQVSTPTITRLLDSLVQRGLVERREDPSDRRRVRLFLTEKGVEIFQELDRRTLCCVEDIMVDMGVEEKQQILVAMEILQRALSQPRYVGQRRSGNGNG